MIHIQFQKENLIKSPLNYTGGKFKLLEQILPLFPDKVDRFVDLFCGGCNVGINVQANKIICNDNMKPLVELYKAFQQTEVENTYKHIFKRIEQFQLSKINKEGYLELRKLYNQEKNPLDLYVCICYSFNNQIRFNNSLGYNMPFGKDRSEFNTALQERLKPFIQKIKTMKFTSIDFRKFPYDKLNKNDLVYCDPPYLISTATYNENGSWTEQEEKELLHILNKLNENNVKFALSNVLIHQGIKNELLTDWAKDYKIHYLNCDYTNCSYHKKDKETKSVEVLITNY